MSAVVLDRESSCKKSFSGKKKYRVRRSADERALIVRDSYQFGVTQTSRLHGVPRSQIYNLRTKANIRAATVSSNEVPAVFASVQIEGLATFDEIAREQDDIYEVCPCICSGGMALCFGAVRLQLPADMSVGRITGLILALEAGR